MTSAGTPLRRSARPGWYGSGPPTRARAVPSVLASWTAPSASASHSRGLASGEDWAGTRRLTRTLAPGILSLARLSMSSRISAERAGGNSRGAGRSHPRALPKPAEDCPRRRLLALDPAQPVPGGPPLNDKHRGLLVEVRVHDLGDVGIEAVAVGSLGEWPGIDPPPRDLRLTRPLRFRALDRVDRGAVQCEPRIPAQIRTLARVRHRAEGELAVLED